MTCTEFSVNSHFDREFPLHRVRKSGALSTFGSFTHSPSPSFESWYTQDPIFTLRGDLTEAHQDVEAREIDVWIQFFQVQIRGDLSLQSLIW